jgi:hypothetical protein
MTEIISLAQAGAVITACWAIISGIGAWQREFIGKRKIELAEQVLARFFEIRDAIAVIRNPFSSGQEGSSRNRSGHETREESELLDRAFIVFERYRTKEAVFAEFNTLKYRFMAAFGPGSEAIFSDTIGVMNSIFVSAQMLGSHYWQRQGRVEMEPEEAADHLKEMQRHQKIFWDHGSEDDEIKKHLTDIQTRLDALVKPCFEEPMRSYEILTRPFTRGK